MRKALLPVLVLLAGCSHSLEDQVAGNWTQKQDAGKGLVGNLVTSLIPKTKVTLNKDHSFVLTLPSLSLEFHSNGAALSTETRVEGRWETNRDKVLFTPQTIGGKTLDAIKQEIEDRKKDHEDAQKAIAAKKQELALQGYNTSSYGESSIGKSDDALVLPDYAKLSDDGKTLTVWFQNGTMQSVDLIKD